MNTVNSYMIPTAGTVAASGASAKKSSKTTVAPVKYWEDATWDPNTYAGPSYDVAINKFNKTKKPYVWNGVEIIDKKGQAAGPLARYRTAYAKPAPAPVVSQPVAQQAPVDNTNALFPSARSFVPESYEGSPLYKWRLSEGEKFLNRKLSAAGLTSSGANVEASKALQTQLSAEEADRANQQAETEADRLERMQQNESLRLERGSNEQFDRLVSLINLAFSQSPLSAGQNAASTLSGLSQDEGQQLASLLSTVPVGGGGGGGGAAPFIPSSPNYSNISPYESLGNTTSGLGYTSLFSNLFSNLLGSLSKPQPKTA